MIARFVKIIALSIFVIPGLAGASALADGLPQVPGATEKAQAGGMTAGASIEGPSGSALEPYLITWLLPAFGIIAAVVCAAADRRLRVSAKSQAVVVRTSRS